MSFISVIILSTIRRKQKKYEALKLQLCKQYEHDRDGYTAAKTQLVTELTEKAKALYGLRYQ